MFRRRYKQHDNVMFFQFSFVFLFVFLLFVFEEREEEKRRQKKSESESSDAVLCETPILPFQFQRVLLATHNLTTTTT